MVTLFSLPPAPPAPLPVQEVGHLAPVAPVDQQDTHSHPTVPSSSSQTSQINWTMTGTTPIVPAIAPASFVEARLIAMRRREQLVSDHLATHGVWPTEITMSALDIIALPVQEWVAFRPDHGIIVAITVVKRGASC